MVFSPSGRRPLPGDTVIFGCGNTLLGDDGYGPAVIRELETGFRLPATAHLVDAGTGIREYLLDYLLSPELRPAKIYILDAVDFPDQCPGTLLILDPRQMPTRKTHDFSLHQFPTVNLLQELQQETGMDLILIAAQISRLPDRIAPGLSPPMQKAVTATCKMLTQLLSQDRRVSAGCHGS